MAIIDNETASKVKAEFSKKLSGEVNLMLFISQHACQTCAQTKGLLEELAAIDARLKLTVYDISANSKEARFLGINEVPALVIGGKRIYNLYYYGIPPGYEFSSLLGDIIDASNGSTALSAATKEMLKRNKERIDIKVFVTPMCPYCPSAVRLAHQMAIESPNVTATMVESSEFPELSNKYSVSSVPHIVVNGKASFVGAAPEAEFVKKVMAGLMA